MWGALPEATVRPDTSMKAEETEKEGRLFPVQLQASVDFQPVEHCTDPALFNVLMELLRFAIILERKLGIKMPSDEHLS